MHRLTQICNHTFIASLLDSNSTIVDLGANVGEFSMEINSTFFCYVFSVEPVPELFAQIMDGQKIKKFNFCVSDKPGPIELLIPTNRCASIYQNNDDVESRVILSRGVTLDSLLEEQNIQSVELLKVDIEGAELGLFASIKPDNLQRIKQVTVEFHDFLWSETHNKVESIKMKLISNGYYCIQFSLNNGDVLFVRKDLITFFDFLYLGYWLKYTNGIKRVVKRLLQNHRVT